jgi:hypothetical protein
MESQSPVFNNQCPECGGHVEDTAPFWKFGASFQCTDCGVSLQAKTHWRALLGLAYGLVAAYLGRFALSWNEANLEPGSITLRLANAVIAFASAVPSVLLLFRGWIYVPNRPKQKTPPGEPDA